MKGSLRQSMAWLHTWGGLLASWLLFAVLWSGTLAVFEPEISHWMQPERQRVSASPTWTTNAQNAQAAVRYLQQAAPDAATWRIELPSPRSKVLEVSWPEKPASPPAGGQATGQPAEWMHRVVDVATGAGIAARESEGGDHFVDFHRNLHAGVLGIWLVAAAGLMMLVAAVSGIIIHKRIFRDFFTFRPRASPQRSWLDGHNAGGVVLLPFHLMIAYTGLACYFAYTMPAALNHHFDGNANALRSQAVLAFTLPPTGRRGELAPVAPLFERAEAIVGPGTVNLIVVRQPGDANATMQFYRGVHDRLALVADHVNFNAVTGELLGSQTSWNPMVRTYRAMVGLHFAQFGGWAMQWLYFFAGMVSCAMVAAGLVLFSVKRRRKQQGTTGAAGSTGSTGSSASFYQLVERLNIVSVAGLVAASAAYLWANRLLPVGQDDRAVAEITVFFVTWLATGVHASVRPVIAGWCEQLGLAALLCLGLPVLDAVTADRALLAALARGDTLLLSVDLAVALIGTVLASIAIALHRRSSRLLPAFRKSRATLSTRRPDAAR
jgi:uncharacterized iron-regulated membrane protein